MLFPLTLSFNSLTINHLQPQTFGKTGLFAIASLIIFNTFSRSAPAKSILGSRTNSVPKPVATSASLMFCTNFVETSKCNNGKTNDKFLVLPVFCLVLPIHKSRRFLSEKHQLNLPPSRQLP